MRKLLTVACVLVLAVTAFAAVASAGNETLLTSRPQMQMTNTGEERMLVFQGHHITPPDGRGGGSILYAPSEEDNATFRADIAAHTGATVDYFDPRIATPDVALLSTYDCVFVWGNFAFLDRVAYGDNLAAYVDGGGRVILGQWCYQSDQLNSLGGMIMTDAYCPVTTSTSFSSGAYDDDGTDCVHDGVGAYDTQYLDVAALVSGASSDGTFNDAPDSLAAAWRDDRMVYYNPGNTGITYGTGDWATLVGNMHLCGGGGPMTTPLMVTGPGAGPGNPPLVRTWDPNDSLAMVGEWTAYGAEDLGVNVACGDLDGDGADSVVTGAGPGAIFGPHVRAFDYMGTPVDGVNYFAYGTLKFGVNVACGDVDGDGMDEIITGAGPGAVFGPHVRGWDVDGGSATPISGINYFAYGTLKWGVNVACGDVDGDGMDEIITGPGPGAVFGPHVRGWDVDGGTATPISGINEFAYGTLKFGLNVGCADLDGDGIDEIITGPGTGVVFGPHIRGWNYDGATLEALSGVNFFAYDGVLYGAQVAGLDLDGDGYDEILTMPGPDPAIGAHVRAWNVDGGTAELITDVDADAYGDMMLMHGGKVAGGGF